MGRGDGSHKPLCRQRRDWHIQWLRTLPQPAKKNKGAEALLYFHRSESRAQTRGFLVVFCCGVYVIGGAIKFARVQSRYWSFPLLLCLLTRDDEGLGDSYYSFGRRSCGFGIYLFQDNICKKSQSRHLKVLDESGIFLRARDSAKQYYQKRSRFLIYFVMVEISFSIFGFLQ